MSTTLDPDARRCPKPARFAATVLPWPHGLSENTLICGAESPNRPPLPKLGVASSNLVRRLARTGPIPDGFIGEGCLRDRPHACPVGVAMRRPAGLKWAGRLLDVEVWSTIARRRRRRGGRHSGSVLRCC